MIRGITISNYSGNSLLNVFDEMIEADSNFLTGMLNAIDSLGREVVKGGLRSIQFSNGIALLFGRFYIKQEVLRYNFSFPRDFPFNEGFVPVTNFNKELDGLVIGGTIPPDKRGKLVDKSFFEVISEGYKIRHVKIYDYGDWDQPKYIVQYFPEFKYYWGNHGHPEEEVVFCMLYDEKDEKLETETGTFVHEKFIELSNFLKDNVQLIGPFVYYSKCEISNQILVPKIEKFVHNYNLDRLSLVDNNLFKDVELNTSTLKNDPLASQMKQVLNHIRDVWLTDE